jgi:dinuclear metal center YbgI/SA1388 family protein
VPLVADVVAFLERFAPPDLAEEWDNVGLLLGDREREAARVLTCLTLTPGVAREAIQRQANLIVTHHPILFRAVKRLTADNAEGRMLLELAAAGVAVYSPHTAYDSAADGINAQLARLLELVDVEPLRPLPGPSECKIVCFVPREHLTAVQEALWSAGSGQIGEYSKCSFTLDGTGSFEGSAASNPAVGQAQRFETVAEVRLEVICPESRVADALRRMRAAHPYEEPACDVYPLAPRTGGSGSGRVGTLPPPGGRSAPLTLADLLKRVSKRLGATGPLPFVGDLQQPVTSVALACGAGDEFLGAAIARQCSVLVTGEARFHSCLEARQSGVALILAGHYATERPAMEYLAGVLSREFPGTTVWPSEAECDPLQWM